MLFNTRRIEFSAVSYWDKQAAAFHENTAEMQDLTQKQLNRLLLSSEYTVLDVGAGTGRLTIPIAKRAKHVTALEPSANMMALLKANVQKEHIQNIEYIDRTIEELDAAAIGVHDIVLASFSLLMVDVEKALLKMDAAALRGVYLFVSASKWMNEEIKNIIYGRDISSPDLPDYIYVYNILHDAGILANVDIWDFQSRQGYNTLDDAASRFMQIYRIPAEKQHELKAYLKKTLTQDDNGKFWLTRKRKAAMIWWTKTQ
jgi:SAM-dependent methyltransferase